LSDGENQAAQKAHKDAELEANRRQEKERQRAKEEADKAERRKRATEKRVSTKYIHIISEYSHGDDEILCSSVQIWRV
jgi:hypothetical protein